MKKVLLSLLAVIVVLGLFAAVGYAGYRVGYAQGAQTKTTANGSTANPALRPFNNFGPRQMPMNRYGFRGGFRRGGVPMTGFGLFTPLMFFGRIVVLFAIFALVVWFIYWLFIRSGWRLTREPAVHPQPAESNPTKPENE